MTNKSTTANTSSSEALIVVTMSETKLVPVNSELEVVGGVVNNANGTTSLLERAGIKAIVVRTIVSPFNGTVPVSLLNPTDNPVVVHKRAKIASIEVIDVPPLATSP